jgi:hypothetical protein
LPSINDQKTTASALKREDTTMYILKLYAVITLGITMARAECYSTAPGVSGLTIEGSNAAVGDFCDHYLAGYFTKDQTKYRCLQLQENVKAEFWVTRIGSGLTLNPEDCKKRLGNEINECMDGGYNTIADWYFR